MSLDDVLAAEAEVAACRRARQRAEQLADEIAAEQRVCQVLTRRLRDERADVDALQGASIRSVLARLRGHHDELLEQEQAEVAEVELELATHREAVQRLTPEFEQVRDRGLQLDEAEARLADALERRAAQLAADPSTSAEFDAVDRRLEVERDALTQFRDARLAALGALGAIERAIESMSTAKDLANLDVFTSSRSLAHRGADLVSSLKHDQLDASVERLAEVHAALLQLRPHLSLVSTRVRQPDLSMPSTRLATFDRWFDDVFSDLKSRRRIVGSVKDLERSREQVGAVAEELTEYERVSEQRVAAAQAEHDALLRRETGS
ncbi:MAG: hypothetical protein HKN41_10325 [Ilumatobacter sp.]|nr:hypothetical protein [Ilumatobacter sp.]